MRFGQLGLVLTHSSNWFVYLFVVLMLHPFQPTVKHTPRPVGAVDFCIEADFIQSDTSCHSSGTLHPCFLVGHPPQSLSHSSQ